MKKYISLITALSLVISNIPLKVNAAANNDIAYDARYGDINSDGIIDSFDVISMRKLIGATVTGNNKCADLNGDMKIDENDLDLLTCYCHGELKAFPIHDNYDTDKDGLSDFIEYQYSKSSVKKSDTDGDGLTDYFETFILGSDPTISGKEAKNDDDGDKLFNIDEQKYNTNPNSADTDDDGLTDYYEIYKSKTDPLVADSDNDGIDDGSEIKLKLDPNSAATHCVPDSEYKMNQAIGKDNGILSSINTEESPYSLSIEMKTNGDIEKEISVVSSGYSDIIDNDAMIGASLDISMSDNWNPENIVLKYDIKPEFTKNTLDKYSDLPEFQGIKRLNVFKFNEEKGMLLPIETKFSDNGTQLYAKVDELGTYCVMDMEKWLDNLGVEMPENKTIANTLQLKYPSSTKIASKGNNNVKLLFMLQAFNSYNAEDYEEKFNSEKETIKKLCKYALEDIEGIDFDIEVLTYDAMAGSFLTNSLNKIEFDNYNELSKQLDDIDYFSSPSPANRNAAYYNADDYLNKTSQPVFIYSFINGNSYMQMGNDNSYIRNWKDNNYVFSQVMDPNENFHGAVPSLAIDATGGLLLDLDTKTDANYNDLKEQLKKLLTEKYKLHYSINGTKYSIVVPTSWKTITLKEKLKKGGKTNSDEDSLTDWQEVIQDKIKIDEQGEIILPMFNLAEAIDNMKRYNDGGTYNFLTNPKEIKNIPYLPIKSDPTDEDTDDDGLLDDEDREPQKVFLNDLLIKLKLMEQYIDDYFEYQYVEDMLFHDSEPFHGTPHSNIEINIIRNLYYGSEKIIKDNLTLKELGVNRIQYLKWKVTDGSNFPLVRKYIDKKDSSIINYFKRYRRDGDLQLLDNKENEIDFLHLLATLGAERYNGIIDPNLAGWAGDLQSFIYNFKIETYGQNFTETELSQKSYEMFTGAIAVSNNKFTLNDLLADVDAKNINDTFSEDLKLSLTLKGYYTKQYKNRFTTFINSYGGKLEYDRVVEKYTKSDMHLIFIKFANDAAENEYVKKKYEDSYVTTIDGIPIYSLPDPSIIKKEELNAIKSGFCKWIDIKLNQERNND